MTDLQLTFDWTDDSDYGIAEHDATFADFAMHVGDTCITAFVATDSDDETARTSLHRPLYPVAEWLACNWWNLLYEPVPAEDGGDGGYPHRHNLRYARSGFALPDVEIQAEGESVRLRWSSTTLTHSRTRFLNDGEARIGIDAFKQTVADFLDAVDERLRQHDVTGTPFQEEWAAIRGADSDEQAFCIAAARLGKYPYGLSDEEEKAVLASGR
jgi:hypothetical protein